MLGLGGLLGSAFGVVGSALNSVVGGLRNIGTSAFEGLGTVSQGTVMGLGDIIVTATSAVASGLNGIVGTVANWAGGVWNSAATFLNNGIVDIVNVFSPEVAEEMGRIDDSYGDYFENIGGVVGDVIENIGGVFEGVGAGISAQIDTLPSGISTLSAASSPLTLSAASAPLTLSGDAPVAPAIQIAPQAATATVQFVGEVVEEASDLSQELLAQDTSVTTLPAPVAEAGVSVADLLDRGSAPVVENFVFDGSSLQDNASLYNTATLEAMVV